MKLKCVIFTEETHYDTTHGNYITSPQYNFNSYCWDSKKIHSMQALADDKGSCKSIVVWYEVEE